jgi:hypothetical protein
MTKEEELKKQEEQIEKRELGEVKEEERLAEEKIKQLKKEELLEEERLAELKKEEDRLKKEQHHEKKFTIIVNGQRKTVATERLSFDEIVNLAYDNHPPTGPNIKFTMTYRNGPPKNPAGDLIENATVEIKDGMIFNVTPTDKS